MKMRNYYEELEVKKDSKYLVLENCKEYVLVFDVRESILWSMSLKKTKNYFEQFTEFRNN